jgi:hypothetical protein
VNDNLKGVHTCEKRPKECSTIEDLSDEVLVAALAELYPRAVLIQELIRRYNALTDIPRDGRAYE